MTKKCKFEVGVDYNPNFFTETEISETIKNAIADLNNFKLKQFGKKIICEPGKINSGVSGNVKVVYDSSENSDINLIETLVSLSSCMDADEDDDPRLILPEPKVEELIGEVRKAFKQ
jgi:hypothetical protein